MILVATESAVVSVDVERATSATARGVNDRPTCLAADAGPGGRAWCGTQRGGVFRSDNAGMSWRPCGLEGQLIMSVTASPAEPDVIWVGTEPSAVWRSADGGETWEQTSALDGLPSSPEWAFPPKPENAATPGQPVVLQTIDPAQGWLGNLATFEIGTFACYSADRSKAAWLPTMQTAKRWQAMVSRGTVNTVVGC